MSALDIQQWNRVRVFLDGLGLHGSGAYGNMVNQADSKNAIQYKEF